MDCCVKTKETDKDLIKEQTGAEKNPVENEHTMAVVVVAAEPKICCCTLYL